MISTPRQFDLTHEWVKKFEAALREHEAKADPADTIAQAARDALQSQLDDLRAELNDYENASGNPPTRWGGFQC
jgi:hypothetical protein